MDLETEVFMEGLGSLDMDLTPQRNDPCYCGSGKKYKKCCQDKDQKAKADGIHLDFEITADPFVLLDLGEPLAPEDEDQWMECWEALQKESLSTDDPVITRLQTLTKKYQNPFVWETLYTAYEAIGDAKQAQTIHREIQQRFPHAFFSRFERAAQALEEERWDAFEACFNGCWALPQLYPERQVFHISEVVLFHLQWLGYCSAISDLQRGKGHFQILKELLEEEDPLFIEAEVLMKALYLEKKMAMILQQN